MPHRELTEILKPDPNGTWPLVIVPSALWKRQVPRILAMGGINTFGLRVDTLSTLAQRLAGNSMILKKLLPLTPASGLALAAEAARIHPGIFAEDIENMGFSRVLYSTISRLRLGLVKPRQLEARARKGGYYSPRLQSLAAIFSKYISLKDSSGLYDTADLLNEASVLLNREGYPEDASSVIMLGYHLHFGAEKSFLENIEKKISSIKRIEEPFAIDCGDDNALDSLKQNLFSESTGSSDFDGSFRILACHGEAGEAREALRQTLRNAQKGIDYQHQAILVPTPSPWSTVLKGLASGSEAEIPLDLHATPSMAMTRPGRALLALYELAINDLPARDLFHLLKSRLLVLPYEEEKDKSPPAGYLQFLCRRGRIVGGNDWKDRLKAHADLLLECADAVEAGEKLRKCRNFSRNPNTLREQSSILELFRKKVLKLRKRLSKWTALASPSAFMAEGAEILQAYHPAKVPFTNTEALKRILDLLRSTPVTDLDYTVNRQGRLLRMLLDRKAPPESNSSGVLIADMVSAAGLPCDSAVIMGLSERVWPPPRSQDPFISEEVSKQLGLITFEQESQYWRDIFRAACRATGKNLTMTYAAVKANEFSPGVPSSHALSAEEAVTGRILPEHLRRAVPPVALSGSGAIDREEFWLGASLFAPEAAEKAMVNLGVTTRNVLELPSKRRGRKLTEWDGLVQPVLAREALQKRYGGLPSPTGLESYASNPLNFLYTNLMRLEVLEEPEEEETPDSRILGSMVHDILQHYLENCNCSGFPPNDPHHRKLLMKHTQKVFEEYLLAYNYMNPLGCRLIQLQVQEALLNWLNEIQQEGNTYRPLMFEMSFGMDGKPPVAINLMGQKLLLRGRIDRVDETAAEDPELRIIDYKSGKCYLKEKDLSVRFNYGRNLQPGIYAIAASKALGKPVAESGYCYLDVGHAGRHMKSIVIPWNSHRRKELEDIISGLVACISSGFFPPGDGKLWTEEENLLGAFGSSRISRTSSDKKWEPFEAATHHPELPGGGENE